MAQQVLQQPQRIDVGYQNPQEEIPLHRLNSADERDNRAHLRAIFHRVSFFDCVRWWNHFLIICLICCQQFDHDRDGFLSIPEMKNLIRQHQCEDIPKEVARQILLMHDDDSNGRLDFEEFYQLSQRHQWLWRGLIAKYCRVVVPSPHRPEQDEIGKNFILVTVGFSTESLCVMYKVLLPY